MKDINKIENNSKQRHRFVTAWLVLMVIANSLIALFYIYTISFSLEDLPDNITLKTIIISGVVSLANVFFSILILKWRKIGFWGFAGFSIITLMINLNIGTSFGKSAIGILGVVVLFVVLQIKKNNLTAWENLD